MLTYTFSQTNREPLYRQLYQYLKNDIVSGILAPDEKLPSKRSFAKNLGISTITVENAYGQLIAEGFVYSLPKRGFFVTDIRNGLPGQEKKGGRRAEREEQGEREYLADFTSNQNCKEQFPFSIWAKLMRATLKEEAEALMRNAPSAGILPLREAIAGHLRQFRGMEVEAGQIVVGAGTEYLYGLLLQLLGMEKCYGVEDPGYHKIYKVYKSHRVACRYVGMDGAGVPVSALEEKGVDVVHISPSHHFPTGIVMPVSRRYELLGWAAKKEGRYIIEDDYDSEFRLTGRPVPSLQSIDVQEKVIYMNTFTKTLSSTVRISYMVLPGHLAERFAQRLAFYSCTVSNFEQYVLARFIEEGYFEKHINRMRNYYREKRDRLLKQIKDSKIAGCCSILEEDAGLHFLLKIDTSLSDEEICGSLEKEGVRISGVAQYYAEGGAGEEHVFVMNYSSLQEENMGKVMERMERALVGEGAGAEK